MKTPLQWLKDEGLFGWNYLHLIRNPHLIFKEIYYEIKYFLQRGKRGYSDRDNWRVDYYLNSWMPQALRNLKSEHGFPVQIYVDMFPDDPPWEMNQMHSTLAHAKWRSVLETMAQGFEAAQKINAYEFKGATELQVLQETMHRGLQLFKDYYTNLWD